MDVVVLSRSGAIRYCHQDHGESAVIISINDPHMVYTSAPLIRDGNGIRSILRLCFCDADGPGRDVYGFSAGEQDLMTDEDARKIAAFLHRHSNVDRVIVHCDAGISRSSGVAAAILKWSVGDDRAVFDNPKFYPNMWCYRKTLGALMDLAWKGETEK